MAVETHPLRAIRWPQEDNKIPREIFTDPNLFHAEMDSIFTGPVWILVGHESEIPNPDDYKTTSVGTIPLIVVRGADGVVRVLVNACAHRGTRLVEGPFGNLGRGGFRCIYHMGTYDTSGDLTGVSLPEDFPADFRKEDYGLPWARVDTYKGAIFALGVAIYLQMATLAVIYVSSALGPPPPSAQALAVFGLGGWLFVPWGYWIDRHRGFGSHTARA